MSRQLSRVILQVSGSVYAPDTGRTVTIFTDDAVPVLVTTAVESPASSAQYTATWTEQIGYGFWYVDGVQKPEWGRIWLGSVVGNVNYIGEFVVNGFLPVTGSVDVSGSVTAKLFIGDGSGLTNVTGSLTRDHAGLTNLPYSTSGHTGFAGTGIINAFTTGQRITGDLQITGSVYSSQRHTSGIVCVADTVTVTTDASLGNLFVLSGSSGRIIGIPTNATIDGQRLVWRFSNTGSILISHTFTTGSVGAWRFPVGTAPTASVNASGLTYVGALYNRFDSRWDVPSSVSQLI